MLAEKTYPIHRSPLYRLRRKTALARLLGVQASDLQLLSEDSNYDVFPMIVGGKERVIERPTRLLALAHANIQRLLRRIEPPDYVYSGRKKRSSIDNARYHAGEIHSLTVDIKQFFPSCRAEFISGFLHSRLKMSPDVARLLSKIVTIDGHVPTGSTLSMSVSYWAYSQTFDLLNELALDRGMRFSLYVDDMTFSSGEPIPRDWHSTINHFLQRVGLELKPSKIKYHSASHYKVITGTAISPTAKLAVSNKNRLKILSMIETCGNLKTATDKNLRSLFGSLLSARRIEPAFFGSTFEKVRKELLSR